MYGGFSRGAFHVSRLASVSVWGCLRDRSVALPIVFIGVSCFVTVIENVCRPPSSSQGVRGRRYITWPSCTTRPTIWWSRQKTTCPPTSKTPTSPSQNSGCPRRVASDQAHNEPVSFACSYFISAPVAVLSHFFCQTSPYRLQTQGPLGPAILYERGTPRSSIAFRQLCLEHTARRWLRTGKAE